MKFKILTIFSIIFLVSFNLAKSANEKSIISRHLDKFLQKYHQKSRSNLFTTVVNNNEDDQQLKTLQTLAFMDTLNTSIFQAKDVSSTTDRAIRAWMMKDFLNVFTTNETLGQGLFDLIKAMVAVAKLTLLNYKSDENILNSGILISTPISKISQIIDLWVKNDQIGQDDAQELNLILQGEGGQKYIKEIGHNQQGGSIIFSVLGFISLKLKNQEKDPLGSLIFARSKFNFSKDGIKFGPSKPCNPKLSIQIGNSYYCGKRILSIIKNHTRVTSRDEENLWQYMKLLTMKNFRIKNWKLFQYVDQQANKLERYLPVEFRNKFTTNNKNSI